MEGERSREITQLKRNKRKQKMREEMTGLENGRTGEVKHREE